MNLIKARLLAIGIAVVFVGAAPALQAAGLEYAIEDCLFAALSASVAVLAAGRLS